MTALDRIDRALGAAGEGLDWSFAVLRPWLPRGIASVGQRSLARIVDIHPDRGLEGRAALSTSLLGQVRPEPVSAARGARHCVGILDAGEQFTITTELSPAAARGGRSAIALRLDQLSPIPVEDAVFAYRRLSAAGESPVRVEVSIARKDRVEAATAALSRTAQSWRLVGALDDGGRPSLEFTQSARQPMGLGLKAVLVSAAVTAALFAWSGRVEQSALNAQDAQAELALQARAAAEQDRQLDAVVAAHVATQAEPRVADWLSALSQLADEDATYSALRMDGREVTLELEGEPVASASTVTAPGGAGSDAGEAAP